MLELPWRIEQTRPDALKGMAEEKLIRFNHVLKEQSGLGAVDVGAGQPRGGKRKRRR